MSRPWELQPLPEEDPQAEAAALHEDLSPSQRLQASPAEEELQHRLNRVDYLLRHAPLVKPGAEFAERLLQRLRHSGRPPFNHQAAAGIVLGFSGLLWLSLFVILSLLLLLVSLWFNWQWFPPIF
jgi:hypothetical protein